MTIVPPRSLIALGGAWIVLVAFSLPVWGAADSGLTVPTGATIVGRVIFRGTVPPPQVVQVIRNPDICGTTQSIQPMLVDPVSHGVKDTVVSLVLHDGSAMSTTDAPSTIPTITNRTCVFHPRIGMAKTGDLLETRNEDPIMHNTHIYADQRTFLNVALVAGGKPVQKKLRKPGLLRVVCDAHTFMQGFVMVLDHDFVSTTNAMGSFSIASVPPGKQEISIWHETLGAFTKHVIVPPRGTVTITFEYP